MAAYVVVRVQILDPRRFADHQQLATASVDKFGGRFVVRGGALVELEGNWDSRRMVILEFPSLERAVSWYHSPEYQHAIEARQGAAILHMVALEGNTLDLAAADPEARG